MKNLLLYALLLFAATGCKKECDNWHEGKNCKNEIRQKYYGSYTGTLTTASGTVGVVFDISENLYGPRFFNLGNYYCEIMDNGSFLIPSQTVFAGNQIQTIDGGGTYSNGEISFYYFVSTNNGPSVFTQISGRK